MLEHEGCATTNARFVAALRDPVQDRTHLLFAISLFVRRGGRENQERNLTSRSLRLCSNKSYRLAWCIRALRLEAMTRFGVSVELQRYRGMLTLSCWVNDTPQIFAVTDDEYNADIASALLNKGAGTDEEWGSYG